MAVHVNPLIVVALRAESAGFRRRGARAAILETGIGPEAVRRTLAPLLRAPDAPGCVLSAGFSGGLAPHLRAGDLVLATEVVEEDGKGWKTTYPARRGREVPETGESAGEGRPHPSQGQSVPRVYSLIPGWGRSSLPRKEIGHVAHSEGRRVWPSRADPSPPSPGAPTSDSPGIHHGRLLSIPRMIASPEEKRILGERHGALAVDMETATVAQLCTDADIPFGCLRVVLDGAGDALPPRLADLITDGRVSPVRVLGALVRRPSLLFHFLALSRRARLAAERLGAGLVGILAL